MAQANRETPQNDATTTLNGAINASVTTVTVTSGAVFFDDNRFRLLVNDEIMLVTGVATNDLTVVRGVEGTTATSHSDLDEAKAIWTAEAWKEYWDQRCDFKPSTQTPFVLVDDVGTILDSTDFSWYEQGTSSKADEPSGQITLQLQGNSAAHHWRGLEMTAPSTPYVIKAFMQSGPGCAAGSTGSFWGLWFRETSSSKLVTNHCKWFHTAACSDWTSATGFDNTNNATDNGYDRAWFQMSDDGTNIKCEVSVDGRNWYTHLDEARGTWFTTGPDRVGFGGNPFNIDGPSGDCDLYLLAWEES
jgi:hypothetical protein